MKKGEKKNVKICWFGIYDKNYSRNKNLISGLQERRVQVVECGTREKGVRKYIILIQKLRALKNDYDVLFCAFPVYSVILIARLLQKRPVVSDAFTPKFDSAIHDRKSHKWYHPRAFLYLFFDWYMIKASDLVITDTQAHKDYWLRWCREEKVKVIPVGTHIEEFFPIDTEKKDGKFLVQFHGSYIPLQGVERLVDMVGVLKNERDIRFRFIGGGQTFEQVKRKADQKNLSIEFVPWLTIEDLNIYLNEADVILGIFGSTPKTDRVIPNKLYQGLAVRKPVITKDTPAIREEFSEKELLLTSNAPEDIANSIMRLKKDKDLRDAIAQNGYERILKDFTQFSVGEQLYEYLKEIMYEKE